MDLVDALPMASRHKPGKIVKATVMIKSRSRRQSAACFGIFDRRLRLFIAARDR